MWGMRKQKRCEPNRWKGFVLGVGLWAMGDEVTVPVLGLSDGPTAYPLSVHIHSFGTHLAYGAATAVVMQALERITVAVSSRIQ